MTQKKKKFLAIKETELNLTLHVRLVKLLPPTYAADEATSRNPFQCHFPLLSAGNSTLLKDDRRVPYTGLSAPWACSGEASNAAILT